MPASRVLMSVAQRPLTTVCFASNISFLAHAPPSPGVLGCGRRHPGVPQVPLLLAHRVKLSMIQAPDLEKHVEARCLLLGAKSIGALPNDVQNLHFCVYRQVIAVKNPQQLLV